MKRSLKSKDLAMKYYEELVLHPHEQGNFFFSADKIIEFASEDSSADPVFRDDFLYLASRLREIDHPSILKLLDFGQEETRLYRVWEARHFSSGFGLYRKDRGETSKIMTQLASLFEGVLTLKTMGLPVEWLSVVSFSLDQRGYFVARFPSTMKALAGPKPFPRIRNDRKFYHWELGAYIDKRGERPEDLFLSHAAHLVMSQLIDYPNEITSLPAELRAALQRCTGREPLLEPYSSLEIALQGIRDALLLTVVEPR